MPGEGIEPPTTCGQWLTSCRNSAMLRSQLDDAREKIWEIVRMEVATFRQGKEYVVPVPAALSSARKP